jgi:hypothetical protein
VDERYPHYGNVEQIKDIRMNFPNLTGKDVIISVALFCLETILAS